MLVSGEDVEVRDLASLKVLYLHLLGVTEETMKTSVRLTGKPAENIRNARRYC